jgi:hypothetical protein
MICACCHSTAYPTDAAPSYFASNDHYYELITSPTLTFNNALSAAAMKVFSGRQGHLATVTSQSEYNFLVTTFGNLRTAWIGANDIAVEGTYRWVTGPEAGQLVDTQAISGFWASGQPDNFLNNEDCLQFWDLNKINDGGCTIRYIYLVEYERKLTAWYMYDIAFFVIRKTVP